MCIWTYVKNPCSWDLRHVFFILFSFLFLFCHYMLGWFNLEPQWLIDWSIICLQLYQSPTILILNNPFESLIKKKKKVTVQFLALICEYFLVYFLLYDKKLNIFRLWTKQDIWLINGIYKIQRLRRATLYLLLLLFSLI